CSRCRRSRWVCRPRSSTLGRNTTGSSQVRRAERVTRRHRRENLIRIMPAEENVNEHIVIITGATPLSADVVEQIPHDAVLIAVDGGLDHALAVGLEPTHLVGDLDSVTDSALTWAARHASISRHPTDKDQTD